MVRAISTYRDSSNMVADRFRPYSITLSCSIASRSATRAGRKLDRVMEFGLRLSQRDRATPYIGWNLVDCCTIVRTRRPASADRRARRQFQATGQLVSQTQASEAMTSRLPRCEAKCVQRRCFQCGSVPLRSDIKGTEVPPGNILIPHSKGNWFVLLLPLRVFI